MGGAIGSQQRGPEEMSLKATLSVLLGCNFGAANRLLEAAKAGDETTVSQVRCRAALAAG